MGDLKPNEEFNYSRPDGIDNVMFYGFKGAATLNDSKRDPIKAQQICRFNTETGSAAKLTAGPDGFRAMVFASKRRRRLCGMGLLSVHRSSSSWSVSSSTNKAS